MATSCTRKEEKGLKALSDKTYNFIQQALVIELYRK